MPYIKSDDRPPVDYALQSFLDFMDNVSEDLRDGTLNYALTRILRHSYPMRYKHQNAAIGMLECVKQEHYRTMIGPYEDTKIRDNGDVE